MVVQAETQTELGEWLSAFQFAKQKALEQPKAADTQAQGLSKDLAFAISPPSAPEFAAASAEAGTTQAGDDAGASHSIDRSSTLPVPGTDLAARNSFDVNASRRPSGIEGNTEGSRDPTSRIISKLDLHKRSTGGVGSGSSR